MKQSECSKGPNNNPDPGHYCVLKEATMILDMPGVCDKCQLIASLEAALSRSETDIRRCKDVTERYCEAMAKQQGDHSEEIDKVMQDMHDLVKKWQDHAMKGKQEIENLNIARCRGLVRDTTMLGEGEELINAHNNLAVVKLRSKEMLSEVQTMDEVGSPM